MLFNFTSRWVSRIRDIDRPVAFMRKAGGVRFLKALLAIAIVMPNLSPAQEIYKSKDEKGQWKYSNMPGSAEQSSTTIVPLPQSGGDCKPFAVGEARELKSASSWSSHPTLQIMGLQVKLVDASTQATHFSWRMQIRNMSFRPESVFGDVNFLDCSGFLLGRSGIARTSVAPDRTIELSGRGSVWGKTAYSVGRFGVDLSGTPMPSSSVERTESLPLLRMPPELTQFPRVVLRWSRLEGVVGNSFVVGEVENTGPVQANEVRVGVVILSPKGIVVTNGTTDVSPSTLVPAARGSFRQRVTLAGIQGYKVQVKPEWTPLPIRPGY
jgi:hypothetical protein